MSTKETQHTQEQQPAAVQEEKKVVQEPAGRLKEILAGNNGMSEELKEKIRKFRERLHEKRSEKQEE